MTLVEEWLAIKFLTSARIRGAVILCSIAKPEWTRMSFGTFGKRMGSSFMGLVFKSMKSAKL